MMARVYSAHIRSDEVDEAQSVYLDEVVQAYRGVQGFQQAYLMSAVAPDEDGNIEGLLLSFWDSEDAVANLDADLQVSEALIGLLGFAQDRALIRTYTVVDAATAAGAAESG